MIEHDVFPTKFFEFQIDQVSSFNLLNEILRKEDELKIISSTRQKQSVEEYITDYRYYSDSNSVKLESLDIIFESIKNEFDQNNSIFNVLDYWTSIYIKSGFHSLHNHQTYILGRCNYSGIIYLSDLGETMFYSNSPTSLQTNFSSPSKLGRVLIFPSSLPHAFEPTYHEENKRYIVAFNCEIRTNE